MPTVGSLVVGLKARTGQFDKNMRRSTKRLRGFRRGLTQTKRQVRSFGRLLLGGGIVYGLTRMITAAANFDKQMAMVATMLDGPGRRAIGNYRKQILELSKTFGKSTDTLAKGLYDILSAGVKASKAMRVLTVSAKAATAGITDTATATRAIVSLLNAYGLEASQAANVADKLFATVAKGVLTFEDLANNIGKVAPMARAAGMPLAHLLGALASLTRQGLKAEEASTQLNAILRAMPASARDLVRALEPFRGKTLAQIMGVVPEQRAAAGIAALAGNLQGLSTDIEAVAKSTGRMQEAFEIMADSASTRIDKLRERWNAFKVGVGERIMGLERYIEGTALGIEIALSTAEQRKRIKARLGYPPPLKQLRFKGFRRDKEGPAKDELAKGARASAAALAEATTNAQRFWTTLRFGAQQYIDFFSQAWDTMGIRKVEAAHQRHADNLRQLRQDSRLFWTESDHLADEYRRKIDVVNRAFGLGIINFKDWREGVGALQKEWAAGGPAAMRQMGPAEFRVIKSAFMDIRGLGTINPQVVEAKKANDFLQKIEQNTRAPVALAG